MGVISNPHEHYSINYSKAFVDNNCETNYYRPNWSQNGFSFPLCQQNSANLIHGLSVKPLKAMNLQRESTLRIQRSNDQFSFNQIVNVSSTK